MGEFILVWARREWAGYTPQLLQRVRFIVGEELLQVLIISILPSLYASSYVSVLYFIFT